VLFSGETGILGARRPLWQLRSFPSHSQRPKVIAALRAAPESQEIPIGPSEALIIILSDVWLWNAAQHALWISEARTLGSTPNVEDIRGGKLGQLRAIFQRLDEARDNPTFALGDPNHEGITGEAVPLRRKRRLIDI
jgi:hypothetical protein